MSLTCCKADNELHPRTKPSVILVIGVNGVGKTTTIGKLASRLKGEGKSVILGAADTFRAAAIEQLEIWAAAPGRPSIKHTARAPTPPPWCSTPSPPPRPADATW